MNQLPLVSVLMTVYNREKYIAEAIESVLSSTYKNFELIIVDDCSVDNSVQIAQNFKRLDNRVQVCVNKKNVGDYPNRNKAVSYARGDYLMFVDSDDKIFESSIEKCVSMMQTFPASNFGVGNKQYSKDPLELSSEEAIKTHFFKHPFLAIGPGGTIIKRDFFLSIGQYPEKYGPANDMYFNLKAASTSQIVLLPFEFVFYRVHEGQQINNKYNYLINSYRYLRDVLVELPLPLKQNEIQWLDKKNKRRFTVNIFKYFIATFNFKKAWNAIQKADFSFTDALTGVFH